MSGTINQENVDRLSGNEKAILDMSFQRILLGQHSYGPWYVHDGRDYPQEALEEVIDALHYCAAGLVKIKQQKEEKKNRVFVCHPFSDGSDDDLKRIKVICREVDAKGDLPIAPQIYLPQFVDVENERMHVELLCLDLMEMCDEVCVYGDERTKEMEAVIDCANLAGKEIKFIDDEVAA